MTCVIAWTNGDQMIMASDSALTSGDQIKIMKEPKFHLISSRGNPDLLIGYAGRAKSGQVLMDLHAVKMPKDTTPNPSIFVTQCLVPILEEVLAYYRLAFEADNGEIFHDNVFLVAYRGSLFTINFEFYVSEVEENYVVIGSGAEYALGAMTAAQSLSPEIDPAELITLGMVVAEKYSASVRRPFKMAAITAVKKRRRKPPVKKRKKK